MSDSEVSDETSDYSETDYGSSSDDEGAAPGPSQAGPRRHGVPGLALNLQGGGSSNDVAARPGMPRIGVPSLGLSRQAEQENRHPATSRGGLAIPSLQLGSRQPQQAESLPLASARPHHRPGAAAQGMRLDLAPVSENTATANYRQLGAPILDVEMAGGRTAVQLVSFAFALPSPGPSSGQASAPTSLASIRDRCVKTLGVSGDDLRLFEIRELPAGTEMVPDGCTSVGVAVNNSGFSMAALETLLSDNRRLTTAADRSSAALESLQHLVREQHQTVAKAQLLAAEKEAETRRIQDRCRYLEREAVALRQQLQRSDLLRLQGQAALDELKEEFEALMRNILAENSSSGLGDTTLSETTSLHQTSDGAQANHSITGVASAP